MQRGVDVLLDNAMRKTRSFCDDKEEEDWLGREDRPCGYIVEKKRLYEKQSSKPRCTNKLTVIFTVSITNDLRCRFFRTDAIVSCARDHT